MEKQEHPVIQSAAPDASSNPFGLPLGPDPLIDMDVDIVFVFDITGSMGHFINTAKIMAMDFAPTLQSHLARSRRRAKHLRTKVITFRDYYHDEEPLLESRFFDMFNEEDALEFANTVNSIEPTGGGDEPESALEALHFAINSDWSKDPGILRRRQIIILVTDASAHSLSDLRRDDGDPANHPAPYPDGVPKDLCELEMEWDDEQRISQKGKRMIMFVPDKPCWQDIGTWNMVTTVFQERAGDGCSEISADNIFGYTVGLC